MADKDDNFLARVDTKGAYIALMEDIFPKSINKQNDDKKLNIEIKSSLNDEIIQKALQDSCNVFNDVMSPKKHETRMYIGKEDKKFLEPCPICYTGTKEYGKIPSFEMVFIGINPHREPAYWQLERSWGELNDFHIPVGELNLKGQKLKADEGNNFWRTSGAMKGKYKCSKYFRYAYFVHRALLTDYTIYGTWKAFCGSDSFTAKEKARDTMLDAFYNHPILNVELIPFKSKKVESLDNKKLNKIMESPVIDYKKYLQDLVVFVDSYAKKDAWIVFFYKTAYEAFKEIINGSITKEYGSITKEYQPDISRISSNKNEIKANATLAKWKNNQKERRIAHLDFYTRGLSGNMIEDFLKRARNYR